MAELLSPAGNMSCLDAALSAGADAVYLAFKQFGARANAGNFDSDELKEASKKVHFLGKKLYLTLNTAVTDSQTSAVLDLADFLYSNRICDGIIVQDLGVVSLLKNNFPALTLHGSTQMCIHSPDGVLKCKELGLDRVVLARECSGENIAECVKTGVEIEIFVHGAYCVSQSGGCLFSSFVGKRSGNRGQCAQPCRLPYKGGYPLSLKDMSLAKHLTEITDMGVCSLKIEGRMKSPEYVYAVTKKYRELLDGNRNASKADMEHLSQVFSRSGFSDGYFVGKKGPEMFGIRRDEDKAITREKDIEISAIPEKTVNICGEFSLRKCVVTAESDGISVTSAGQCQPATGKGLEQKELEARLSKVGGTGFKKGEVAVSAEEGIFMPVSAVNALRRDVLEKLTAQIIIKNSPKEDTNKLEISKGGFPFNPRRGDVYRIFRPEYGFTPPEEAYTELPVTYDGKIENPDKTSVFLPRVIFPNEKEDVIRLVAEAKNKGVKAVTVSNISHLCLCEGMTVYGDFGLNVTNSETARVLEQMGLSGICVSPEVTPRAVKTDIGEYIVYGRQVMMHTENCIIKNLGGCNEKCHGILTDRMGKRFPVYGEYNHRNLIFNCVPTYLLDKDIPHTRVFLITDEKKTDIPKEFTRGYY